MSTLKVMPREGARVKRPATEGGTVLEDGVEVEVPATSFWRRRLKGGDVVVSKPKAAEAVAVRRAKAEE